MNGLEKIFQDINEDAKKECNEIINKANKTADEIINKANEEAKKILSSEEENLKNLSEDLNNRGKSTANLEKRRIILLEKQKIISDIIQKVYNKLLSLPDKEYFDILIKIAEKNIQGIDGEIIFNEKDKQRLPNDFIERLNKKAQKQGGNIKLSENTVKIDGGFKLIYGGIEENCSFSSMFHSNQDALKDKLNEIVFEK